jgi:hypothetical protein
MARAYNYASHPDVLQHLTHVATFTSTARPNATQVHSFLTDVSDELDAAISAKGYDTPVATDSASFDLVNSWAAIGGAMHAAAAAPQGKGSAHLEFLERRWTAILKRIDGGQVQLSDGAKDADRRKARTGGAATGYFLREDVSDV